MVSEEGAAAIHRHPGPTGTGRDGEGMGGSGGGAMAAAASGGWRGAAIERRLGARGGRVALRGAVGTRRDRLHPIMIAHTL